MVEFSAWFATLLWNWAQLIEGNKQFLPILTNFHHVVSYDKAI
jgi:hypothetical protein